MVETFHAKNLFTAPSPTYIVSHLVAVCEQKISLSHTSDALRVTNLSRSDRHHCQSFRRRWSFLPPFAQCCREELTSTLVLLSAMYEKPVEMEPTNVFMRYETKAE